MTNCNRVCLSGVSDVPCVPAPATSALLASHLSQTAGQAWVLATEAQHSGGELNLFSLGLAVLAFPGGWLSLETFYRKWANSCAEHRSGTSNWQELLWE